MFVTNFWLKKLFDHIHGVSVLGKSKEIYEWKYSPCRRDQLLYVLQLYLHYYCLIKCVLACVVRACMCIARLNKNMRGFSDFFS